MFVRGICEKLMIERWTIFHAVSQGKLSALKPVKNIESPATLVIWSSRTGFCKKGTYFMRQFQQL
jgi:hypothetical protein